MGDLLDAKRQQVAEEQQAKCDEIMLNATTKQTVLPVKATVQKLVAKKEESEQSKAFERDLTEKLVANCSEKDTIIASLQEELVTARDEIELCRKIAVAARVEHMSKQLVQTEKDTIIARLQEELVTARDEIEACKKFAVASMVEHMSKQLEQR